MLTLRTTWIAAVSVALWAAPSPAAAPTGLAGAGKDADRWIVDNADFVLAVNVKQLSGSTVMAKGGSDAVAALLQAEPKAKAVIEAAGVDLSKDIDSVLVSGTVGAKASDSRGVVVVKGRFDPDKAFAAARKSNKVEVVTDSGLSMLKLKVQDHDAFAAFVGKDAIVITQGKDTTASWAKNGGKAESKLTAAMKSSLGGFKGTETVTFALVLNETLRQMIGKVPQVAVAGQKMQALTASVNVTDRVDVKAVASTSDARGAKQLATALGVLKGLGEVMVSADENYGEAIGDVLNEVKITTDGNNAHLALTVDKSVLEKAGKKKN